MTIRTGIRLLICAALTIFCAAGCGDSSGSSGDPDGGTGPDARVGPEIVEVTVSGSNAAATAEGVVVFGQVFSPGDAPESVTVEIDGQGVPTQVDVKRRNADGSLRHAIISAALPALAALGGMVVPAALYLAFTIGTPNTQGWGIPMATDIALAVGVIGHLVVHLGGKRGSWHIKQANWLYDGCLTRFKPATNHVIPAKSRNLAQDLRGPGCDVRRRSNQLAIS